MTQTTQTTDLGQIPQYPHPFHTPETWADYQASLPPAARRASFTDQVILHYRTNQAAGYYLTSPFPLNIPDPSYTPTEVRDFGRFERRAHIRGLRRSK